MQKRHLTDAVKALGLLGCQAIIPLHIGQSWHISAARPTGELVYLHDVQDVEKLILELARERARAARA
jgi:hypothetical protein